MTMVRHMWFMALRDLRALWRQPWFVAVTLVQPLIWLLLFGELFKRVADLPGFGHQSYIAYLAPGIVVMSALFSSGWNGMATIEDINRGVTDRLLVSPIRRSALIAGRVTQSAVVVIVQSVIMILLALAVGASFPGGVLGVVVLIVVSGVLGASFGALSNALALVTRQEESLIGAVTFLVLPLTFLSTALMRDDLLPGWMRTAADVNPVDWAIEAGRSATAASPDWGMVVTNTAMLLALLVVSAALATRAFKAYQRSV
jgi:ABC-2 type transport system permease protein